MIISTLKPTLPGWYWRRRYNDNRSKWKPIKVPSREACNIDKTAIYEWAGPIREPS